MDTSYLLEIYRVPGHFNDRSLRTISERFRRAIDAGSRLYVPFPVLFELGNHMAHVRDGRRRRELAHRLAADIRSAIEHEHPWVVTPYGNNEVLLELGDLLEMSDRFAAQFAEQGIGLSDLSVLSEAGRLKRRYQHGRVHIWTTDRQVKTHEPDPEP